jgi:cell division septation protein DedD
MNDEKKNGPQDNDELPFVDRPVGENDNIEFLNRNGDEDPESDDFENGEYEDDPVDDPGFPDEFAPPEIDEDAAAPAEMATPINDKSGNGRRPGPSRIMIGAGVVILAIALWVFWPRGGDTGDMTGQTAVLTLDPAGPGVIDEETPRSSDVDLGEEVPEMVPEQPASNRTTTAVTEKAVAKVTDEAAKMPPLNDPLAKADEKLEPAAMPGDPAETGKWAVQLGAFGSEKNAQKMGDVYRNKGFRVEVPAMRTTGGGLSYKVWIGFFNTRGEANEWAQKHKSDLGDFYITHR